MVICRVEQVEGRLQLGTQQTLLKAFATILEDILVKPENRRIIHVSDGEMYENSILNKKHMLDIKQMCAP